MNPTGWFQLGWSTDFGPEAVKPLHYFGSDLVAYRGKDGAIRVHDGHCQHLGAHLGYGGCVTDDGIQCPFHGWVWGPDGRNASIPYQDRPNKSRRVRPWPVAERNESIYLWHDAEGRDPLWEVPDALVAMSTHVAGRDFYPVQPSHHTGLRVHPQTVAENAVDPHHFRFVHGTPISPVVVDEHVDEVTWQTVVGFGKRWMDHTGPLPDNTLNTIAILFSGLGVSFNAEHTSAGVRMISINVTPVDDENTELFASYWIDHSLDGSDDHYEERLNEAMLALPDDLTIWQHQRYTESPALATSEADGFTRLRRWATGFYPARVE
jgi:phenylpropionate dioxygenase-like ring-hydroxylating dioxygenase large terminal subunit